MNADLHGSESPQVHIRKAFVSGVAKSLIRANLPHPCNSRTYFDAESIATRTVELDKEYIREQLRELSSLSDVPDMRLHAERILSRQALNH